jgi:hypothetical protein
MNPLSPDVLTVQKYHGTERRVGLFQQQWQTRRIFSRTLARFFTICGAKPQFSLCHQRRHFHVLYLRFRCFAVASDGSTRCSGITMPKIIKASAAGSMPTIEA